MRIAAIVIGVLLLVPACGGKSGSGVECAAPTDATTVELQDFAFSPKCLRAAAGSTITVSNTGATAHSFTVTSVDINVDLGAGGSQKLDVSAEPGTYDVICSYHPQMVGALQVVATG
jgi:plastocyanin